MASRPKVCRSAKCSNPISDGSRTGFCVACYNALRRIIGDGNPTKEQLELAASHTPQEPCPLGGVVDETDPIEKAEATFRSFESDEDYEQEIPLVAGDTMLAGDLHLNRHDSRLVGYLMKVGYNSFISQLVLGGDTNDFTTISRHRKSAAKQESITEQLLWKLKTLLALTEVFDKIWEIPGNHDDRILRMLEGFAEGNARVVDFFLELFMKTGDGKKPYRYRMVSMLESWCAEHAPKLLNHVTFGTLPIIDIEGPAGQAPYRVFHPALYSRLMPNAERKLWPVHQRAILGFHGHGFGIAVAPNGVEICAQVPAMTEARKHDYLYTQPKDFPRWVKGFARIQNGIFTPFVDNPYLTDWNEVDREYYERRDEEAEFAA